MPIEINFPKLEDKKSAQSGQKADATPCTIVSISYSGNEPVPFGALLVYHQEDPYNARLPTANTHLDRPVGISLRQNHGENYSPKSFVAAIRQGRVWVKCDEEVAPGEQVYVISGGTTFTKKGVEKALKLDNAVYLENSQNGLVPIEVNFLGVGQ